MGEVQAAQLLAQGEQDAWLSGTPEISFYRSCYKRHIPFAMSLEQFLVPPNGTIVVNPKSDMIGYTYLTAHDPSLGTLVPNADWSNIISTVELVIGNQTIAKHDLVYINTIQRVLEADTFSKRSQTPGFQPLGFFFDRQALPLVALKYTDVKINISWVSTPASVQYIYRCWSHCIHLGEDERQFFATRRLQMLIPKMQRTMLSNQPTFYGPLKYIAAPCVNYTSVYILPKAVSGLTVSGATYTTVNLEWTASSGILYYSIVSTPATTTQTTSGTSYTFTGLSDGVSYRFTVTPIGPTGAGPSVTSSSISTPSTIPTAVTNLTVSGATTSSINLAWTGSSSGLLSYYSIVSTPATTTQTTGGTSYTFTGLSGSTSYTFTVTPVGPTGVGPSVTSSSISTLSGLNISWAAKLGAGGIDTPNKVDYDSSGNMYVFGTYQGSCIVYNSLNQAFTPQLGVIGGLDVFLVKYSTTGTVVWDARIGSGGTDYGYGVTVDSASGSVYVVGGYTGTCTFYNSSLVGSGAFGTTLAQIGNADIYVAKYDTSGNVIWVARAGSAAAVTEYARDVILDSVGNIYVTGVASGSVSPVTFYNSSLVGSGAFSPTISAGGMFLAKYDSSGNVLWTSWTDGPNTTTGNSVAVDSSANVFSCFTVSYSTINIYTSSSGATLSNNRVGLVKWDSTGTPLWVARFDNAGSFGVLPNSVACDSSGNSYLFGSYAKDGPLKFYNSDSSQFSRQLSVTGSNPDLFIAKYDPNGFVQWVAQIGGSPNKNAAAVTVAASSVYVTGYLSTGTHTFYNWDGTVFDTLIMASQAAFIAKYDMAGNVIFIMRAASATTSTAGTFLTTSSSTLYLGGIYTGTCTVYSSDGSAYGRNFTQVGGTQDVFVANYTIL